jgi:WD40 repeat protein
MTIWTPRSLILELDKTVRLWEAATGTCRSTLKGYSMKVMAVTFSPDRQVLHTNAGNIPLLLPLNCTSTFLAAKTAFYHPSVKIVDIT